jgi:Mn-containing catalase
MFHYEKKLQYPVKIKNANPKLASWIISQYGGPDTRRLRCKNEISYIDQYEKVQP